MLKILLLSVLAVAMIGLMAPSAFGQLSVQTINIVNGASNEECQPNCFMPYKLQVPVGSKIIFYNYDSTPHYTVSGDVNNGSSGIWASEAINPGSKYSLELDEEGEHDYYCTAHPWMTGKIIVTDPTKSVIPLEDFFRSEMSGDTQFVRIFMPSLKPIPEVDIPIGIKFTNDVEFSGNPITISLVNDGWEVISSKKIYPQNIDEKIISHIRLESEDNCEPCAVHVNYNGFTTQVPFFFSNGPFLFIPDKQVYSPNDQVELTFISPQSNITPNMDTLGPIVIQDGTAPLRADISFDAMENDFESGVFIASLKLVPSSNEPLCVESMTNHSAELKQELSQMRLLCVYDGDDGSLKKHGRQDLPVGINNELLGGWVFSIRVSDDGSTSVDHVHLDGTSHDHVNGNKAHVHESQLSSENQEQFSSIQINGNNVDVTDAPPFVVNDDSIITFSGVVNVSSLSDGLANVVTVQILSPSPPGDSYGGTHNDIISVEQITPDQQGNFSLDILPQGSAWNLAGYYQIKIFYDGAEEHYMINFPGQSHQTESISEIEMQESITEEIIEEPQSKPILSFVDPEKDPSHYVKRYITEETYKDWFHEHFPDYTLYEGIGITQEEYRDIVDELSKPAEPEPVSEPVIEETIVEEPEPEPIPTPTQESSRGGGCLIATAAFGSEMAPQVQFLRELRDNTVMSTQSGTAFMTGFNQFYYSFSPQIADYERENPVFKEAVKVTLTPLLTSLTLLNYVEIDYEEEMLGYGIGIILLNVGMYFVAPAVLIIALKNRLKN